jgi:UDP-glucuronate 4-epimerase
VSGKRAKLDIRPVEKGDVRQTLADVSLARQHLGYQPKVDLRAGLAAEWQWVTQLYQSAQTRQG